MKSIRYGNVHEIDLWILKQSLVGTIRFLEGVTFRRLRCCICIPRSNGIQYDVWMSFCWVDGYEGISDSDAWWLWFLHAPAAGLICAEESTPIFRALALLFFAGVAWSHEFAYW